MPASLILPLFFTGAEIAAGGLAVSAAAFAIRLAATYALSSLLTNNQKPVNQGTPGGQIMLGPATDNKVPVVYGSHVVAGIITDAILSTDQQTMWYVITFAEATDTNLGEISFGEVYYDNKLLIFDYNNPGEILGWQVMPTKRGRKGGDVVTGVAGKLHMWFYNNGSASTGTQYLTFPLSNVDGYAAPGDAVPQTSTRSPFDILGPSNTRISADQQWDETKLMSNAVFAIIQLDYDAGHGISGLGSIKARIVNPLGAGEDQFGNPLPNRGPGSAMLDYMTNTSYGAGLDPLRVDTTSLAYVDTISALPLNLDINYVDTINITSYTTGTTATNYFTYQINGIVDTTNDCLTNLAQMTDAVDGWLQWNEKTARWGVILNQAWENTVINGVEQSTSTAKLITADNIIGGIDLIPTDLASTPNILTINFPNVDLFNQTDYRYFYLNPAQRNPNEPNNNLTLAYPLVTDSLQASWLGYKKLFMGREDLAITFTMDYSGIGINAGDVVCINHEWYGWSTYQTRYNIWPGRPFRVTQVREQKATDGFLSVQVTAVSYNDAIYFETNPAYVTPAPFGILTDPTLIGTPSQPTVTYATTASSPNYFTVTSNLPTFGQVEEMQFWYSTTSTIGVNNFTLYEVQYYSTGTTSTSAVSLYPNTGTESCNFINLPSNTYYFATKAIGPKSSSDFSLISEAFTWTNLFSVTTPINGSQILDNSIPGTKVTTGDAATQGTSQSKGFFDTMGPLLLGGLGLAAVNYGYKQGIFDSLLPADFLPKGGGNDAGGTPVSPTTTLLAEDGTPIAAPQQGDTVQIVADATPDPGPLSDYSDFSDYSGGGGGDFSDFA